MRNLILFLFLFCTSANAQTTQSLPNGDFSNWSIDSSVYTMGPVNVPDDWYTSDLYYDSIQKLFIRSVFPDTVPYSSPYALRVWADTIFTHSKKDTMPTFAGVVFPISGFPTALTGFYKRSWHDTICLCEAKVAVILTKSNGSGHDTIAIGEQSFNQSDTVFKPLYIPINYLINKQPDTAAVIVGFRGARWPAAISVDDLSFDLQTTDIALQKPDSNEKIRLYPNPASSSLNIWPTVEITSIHLFDMQLRPVLTEENISAENKAVNLDISILPPGIYLCRITSPAGIFMEKVIVR